METKQIEKVIIVGSGPAAHTAAIYAARAELKPLLFEGYMAGGIAAGGQLTTTTEVENFPGFPDGISGPDLMLRMRDQSEEHGTRILTETVETISQEGSLHVVHTANGTYRTKALIIATGATAKRLDVPGQERLWQKGISACAVCDGALPMFREKELVIVGGGDAACEEAHFLTKYGKHVHMLVRRDVLRASKAMQKRVLSHEKIIIHWHTQLREVLGETSVSGVKVINTKENKEHELPANGLFFAIGHTPNTKFLGDQLELDDANYIITHNNVHTSKDGIFACGDVQDKIYRQAITSAGSGCMAALEAEHFLSDLSD